MDKVENSEVSDGVLMAFMVGELDLNERQKVIQWLLANEKNQTYFDDLVATWDLVGKEEQKPLVDADAAWNRVRNQIQGESETPVIPLKKNRNYRWAVAASIVVLLGVFSVIRLSSNKLEMISHVADYPGVVDHLSDGSVVTLNENSRIDYPKNFGSDERRIALSGEAFFEIERDVTKPFIIDLFDQTYVKVLGTSFNIKAAESDTILSVYVASGKVEFGGRDSSLILLPGETGYYRPLTGKFWKATETHHEEVVLFWKTGEIIFDNQPLSEVVETLNEVFTEDVILDCEASKSKLTNSKLKEGESLRNLLTALSELHQLDLKEMTIDGKTTYFLTCKSD